MDNPKSTPLFIVGPHRSGTSALLQVIRDAFKIPAFVEGHIWPLALSLARGIERTRSALAGFKTPMSDGFFIDDEVAQRVLTECLNTIDTLHRERLKCSIWADKTPGIEMIEALPILTSYFDSFKVIFLQRSGIDTVISSQTRFPGTSFRGSCESWAPVRRKWAEVQQVLPCKPLLLEQADLFSNPEAAAIRLREYLDRPDVEVSTICAVLERRKEATATHSRKPGYSTIEDTNWTPEEIGQFLTSCGLEMLKGGYPLLRPSRLEFPTPDSRNLNSVCRIHPFGNQGHFLVPNGPQEPRVELAYRALNAPSTQNTLRVFGFWSTLEVVERPIQLEIRVLCEGKQFHAAILLLEPLILKQIEIPIPTSFDVELFFDGMDSSQKGASDIAWVYMQ